MATTTPVSPFIGNTLDVGSRFSPQWLSDAIQIGGDPYGNTALIEGNTLLAGAGIYVHGIRGAEIRDNHITANPDRPVARNSQTPAGGRAAVRD